MAKITDRSPETYGPDDTLLFAIVARPMAENNERWTCGRVSNDGKWALTSALESSGLRPSGWGWMTLEETRALIADDPNWQPAH